MTELKQIVWNESAIEQIAGAQPTALYEHMLKYPTLALMTLYELIRTNRDEEALTANNLANDRESKVRILRSMLFSMPQDVVEMQVLRGVNREQAGEFIARATTIIEAADLGRDNLVGAAEEYEDVITKSVEMYLNLG